MSFFTKFIDPIFETNKENQLAFEGRFNTFYEKASFHWTSRTFSFLPSAESLKIQALYSKITPLFECTSLAYIHKNNIRILKKDIFGQKQDLTQREIEIDISAAPYFQWLRLNDKTQLLKTEFGVATEKFQILAFKIRPDYALVVATAQAHPWLKIKLDALADQIVLGFCDHE